MKKMTFILACLMMAALSANAQISKVILQHQGNVTMYEPDDIQTAITAAQDGDTILLNSGSFPGFTIEKRLSIIGGQSTYITGDINVSIPNKPTLTSNLLEGLKISRNSIKINQAVNGLSIKKCTFYDIYFSGYVNNVSIDRCNIELIKLSEYILSLNVNNSVIKAIYGTAHDDTSVEFRNCHLTTSPSNVFSSYDMVSSTAVTFINSLVYNYVSSTWHYSNKCKYLNCAVRSKNYGIYNDECTTDYDTIKNYSSDKLEVEKYLGTDGTIIGENGGTTPYTLVTTAPKVTDSSVGVTTDMKALNVNITVTPN